MPSPKARFRVSIKDQNTKTGIKVELIDTPKLWPDSRYRIRVNGRQPNHVQEATLTEVFDRLRRWVVRRSIRR